MVSIKNLKTVFLSSIALTTIIFLSTLSSCTKTPTITDDMMDGDVLQDSSLIFPKKYYISERYADSTNIPVDTNVIMNVHGFSASTFEWTEFRDWSDSTNQQYLNSLVLLGGHGRDYDTFRNSTWQDWQDPIANEYSKLVNLGFKNISLTCSSTGCPLILELFASGFFDEHPPKEVLMIDPIIFTAIKSLTMVDLAKYFLPYVETGKSDSASQYWYYYRPSESLDQLEEIITRVRKQLESGIKLSKGTQMKVWKSKIDDGAAPVSILSIYKGTKTSDNKNIDAEMVDSQQHVFTRLKYRDGVNEKDRQLQLTTFQEISDRVGR